MSAWRAVPIGFGSKPMNYSMHAMAVAAGAGRWKLGKIPATLPAGKPGPAGPLNTPLKVVAF